MSRDQILLDRAERGEAGCRVYSWGAPWVTLGRYQSPERDLCSSADTSWVIRPTGGKAVLHGHDITVGLAVPLNRFSGLRSIKSIYPAVVAPLVNALRACDVPAALAEETPHAGKGQRTADCFAHVSPNDVVDVRSGKKVCGCALRVTQTAVLVQASLPYRSPILDPASVMRNAESAPVVPWDPTGFGDALEEAIASCIQWE